MHPQFLPRCTLLALTVSLVVGCPPTTGTGNTPPVVCPPGPIILNTGLWGTSSILSTWDPDDDWEGNDFTGSYMSGNTLVSNVVGVNPPAFGGGTQDTLPNSAWIRAQIGLNIDHWEYEFDFCLPTGFQNPVLDLNFLARDEGTVRLNGNLLFGPGGGIDFPATNVNTADPAHFVAGTNLVTVQVTNDSFINAILDVGGTVSYDAPPPTDIELTKSVNVATPAEGDTVVFTLQVENTSGMAASGVMVNDLLPAGLTYLSDTPSVGSYNSTSGDWDVGVLLAYQVETLEISATVDAGTQGSTLTNTAEVSATDQDDVDSVPGDADPSQDDIASVDVLVSPPPQVDLDLTKTTATPNPAPGAQIMFELTLTNTSAVDAHNVFVSDVLPVGLNYDGASGVPGFYNVGTGTWNVGTIVAGGTGLLTMWVTVDPSAASTQITNTAEVSAVDEGDLDSTPGNGITTEDDYDEVIITVGPPPSIDLELTKTTATPSPQPGSVVAFQITVTNTGLLTATGVEVTDILPAGVTFNAASTSSGPYDPLTGVWSLPQIYAGYSVTLLLYVTVDANTAGTTITNTAEVTAADQTDPDSTPGNGAPGEDDIGSATLMPPLPVIDLQANIFPVSGGPYNVGNPIYMQFDVFNQGTYTANNVELQLDLPAGLTVTSTQVFSGTYDSLTGIWTVPTMPFAVPNLITMWTTVDAGTAGTTMQATLEVIAADEMDVDSTPNNQDLSEDDISVKQWDVNPEVVDLELTKTSLPVDPAEGDPVTYSITLTNNSAATATGVVVTDQLPAGVTYVSHSAAFGSYDAVSGEWTVASMTPFLTGALNIVATVDVGQAGNGIFNSAEVTAQDQTDIDSVPNNGDFAEDDIARVAIFVQAASADLDLSKSVDVATAYPGGTIAFTVTVTNNGASATTGVTVTDPIPLGLVFSSYVASTGTYNDITGVWTVGAVAAYTTETLTLYATVDPAQPPGPITNRAQIATSDVADPDSTPGNGDPTEDDQAEATVDILGMDLQLVKIVDNATPTPGLGINYTLTLSNTSPVVATNIEVTDILPAGVAYVTSVAAAGSYNNTSGVWSVPSLNSFTFVSVIITVDVTGVPSQVVTNVAEVTAVDQIDVDSTPNNGVPSEDDQDEVTITIQ